MSSVQETSRSHANKPNTSVTGTSNSTKVNYVPYHKNRAANEKYKEQQVSYIILRFFNTQQNKIKFFKESCKFFDSLF